MTLREAQAEGTSALKRADIDTPSLDASLLLGFAADLSRGQLLSRGPDPVEDELLSRYRNLIEERARGICVAYLTGKKEFHGRLFRVTPEVLVPRPDTETLVEAALAWMEGRSEESPPRAVDVCTGSGCIAVTLKAERPSLDIAASDLSPEALSVAKENARTILGDDGAAIDFRCGDLLEPFAGSFDLIVSNPPYVPSDAINLLSPEVRGEPRMALDGGSDGLDLIRRLIAAAAEKLVAGGRLFIEAGHDQADRVADLMRKSNLSGIEFYKDLSGIARVTGGSKS